MNLHTSIAPHVHDNISTQEIMRDVLIALAPATLLSVFYFGWRALLLVCLSVGAAVGAEALTQRAFHRPVTINDLSAAVTGLLVALNVPVGAPWWIPVCGSVIAICLVKQIFGGLGFNLVNPALLARAVLLASWASTMSGAALQAPTMFGLAQVDGVSSATALALLKDGSETALSSLPSLTSLLVGNTPGMLGETSVLALLAGGIYLIGRQVITWHIPVIYIGTTAVLTFFFTGFDAYLTLVYVLSGGLFLGAFFMAADYVGRPSTIAGQCIFAFGCGLLTVLTRFFSGYPEGVSYSILLMNLAAPLIDRFVYKKAFGEVAKHA